MPQSRTTPTVSSRGPCLSIKTARSQKPHAGFIPERIQNALREAFTTSTLHGSIRARGGNTQRLPAQFDHRTTRSPRGPSVHNNRPQ